MESLEKQEHELLETFLRNEKNGEREVQKIEPADRTKKAPCRLYSFCET